MVFIFRVAKIEIADEKHISLMGFVQFIKYFHNLVHFRIIKRSIFYGFVPLLTFYLIAPFLVWLFPYFFQHIFFLNFVKIPFTEYNNLQKYNVSGRNFYLKSESDSSDPILGVWHIFPTSLRSKLPNNLTHEITQKLVNQHENGILIYLHGNSFDRTTPHRLELYRLLSAIDLHILAIDYRGNH